MMSLHREIVSSFRELDYKYFIFSTLRKLKYTGYCMFSIATFLI